MLKNKQKLFAVIFLIIATVSTLCFAENTDDIAPISEEAPVAEENVNEEPVIEGSAENEADVPSESTDGETSEEGEPTDDLQTEEPNLIENDLYLAGNSVTVNTTDYIDGNVYVLADDVTISGQIGGDLFVLANNLNITQDSYTYGNLYVCANSITIDGIVCDLYAACSSLTIGQTGIILRDARTTSNIFTINGSIGRNAFVNANEVTVSDTVHIYGDFNYSSNNEIVVPSGVVDGSINYEKTQIDFSNENVGEVIYSYVLDFVYTLVYTLVVFGLILLIAPKFIEKLQEIAKSKKLASFGIGLLMLVLVPIIALLLVFTVIGTPLSFAVAALYALVVSISFTITATVLSKLLSNKVPALGKFKNVFALAIVTLVLWLLTQIPFFIGGVIRILITIYGVGVFTLSVFKKD